MIRFVWRFAMMLWVLIVAQPAVAFEPLKVDDLALLPVHQDGRIKPLEQFARVTLRQLSGAETLGGIDALPWLIELLFTPELAAQRPLFTIKDATLREALHLPARVDHRYSAQEVTAPLLQQRPLIMPIVLMNEKERSTQQQALMELYQRFSLFSDVQQSFSLILPLNAPRPAAYGLPDPLTYLDLQRIRETLRHDAKALANRTKGDVTQLASDEHSIVALALFTERLEQQSQQSRSLRILPASWSAAQGAWFAPWDLLREGYGSPASATYLERWKKAALAYRDSDAGAWRNAVQVLVEAGNQQVSQLTAMRLKIEYAYIVVSPLTIAWVFCSLAALLSLMPRNIAPRLVRTIMKFALLSLCAALAVRIFILSRPPVGTLYESLLFVSAILIAAASLPRSVPPYLLMIGAIVPAILLGLAPFFANDETMGMLSAVLNTDFWLTVHVLCITSGYAVCLLAGGLAHTELWQMASKKQWSRGRDLTLYVLAALALTATGTLLGGIWADQSWGRFWGWDPKENGALLIVLWIIWVLHARQAGQLSPIAYLAAMAMLNVVVALAWFGVNMLGIGLHSYGFTQATALGLIAFCGGEFMLIGWLAVRARGGKKRRECDT